MPPPSAESRYRQRATRAKPGHIVYALDLSWSMQRPLAGSRRIDVALSFLRGQLAHLRRICSRDGRIEDRYRVAVIAYSDELFDLLGGFQPISAVPLELPTVEVRTSSAAAAAFDHIARLLTAELPALVGNPAPLVWHLTDGAFTGGDASAAVERLRAVATHDGAPLLAHLLTADVPQWQFIHAPREWHGVEPGVSGLAGHVRALIDLSSPLPDSYRQELRNEGYVLTPGAVMLFPGRFTELAQLVMPPTTDRPDGEVELPRSA